jgi:hypothetical protein
LLYRGKLLRLRQLSFLRSDFIYHKSEQMFHVEHFLFCVLRNGSPLVSRVELSKTLMRGQYLRTMKERGHHFVHALIFLIARAFSAAILARPAKDL